MGIVNQGGKGSGARPLSVSREQFGSNFDAIFGKKKPAEENVNKEPVTQEGFKEFVHAGKGDVSKETLTS
jgi:hypothetical protein